MENAAATLTGTPTGVTVLEGTLSFGAVPAGATVTSSDTFMVRHDRRYSFKDTDLVWSLTFDPGPPSNTPPRAQAGADQTAFVTDTVHLNGTGSTDAEGDPLSYHWTWVSLPEGSGAVLSDATAPQPTVVVDLPGVYTAQLVVHDGTIASAPDTVVISTENSAPVAGAGSDQTVVVTTTVELDGSGSTDVDQDPLTFRWFFESVPAGSQAVLSDPTSVQPTFEVDVPGEYVVHLVVNDGVVDSFPATVVISTENSAPTAQAGPDQTVTVGTQVTLTAAGSSDPDGDVLSYRWALLSVPQGSAAVLSDAGALQPTFVADRPGEYVAQLIVSDGAMDSFPDTVVISTENSRPLANAGQDRTALVGELVTLDGSGSSDADGHALSYRWSLTTRPSDSTVGLANETTATPSFIPDQPGLYVAQLIVSDGFLDSDPDTARVTVEVVAPTDVDNDGLSDAQEQALGTNPANPDSDGDGLQDGAEVTTHQTNPLNPDSDGDTFSDGDEIAANANPNDSTSKPSVTLPPDPATVAPPVDQTATTMVHAATEFLYSGPNPIQTGVAENTIEPQRAAVLRGQVATRDGQPLAGVTLAVLDHPEYGQTLTRADGQFDLAVNGGGLVVLTYQRAGYLPAQRQVNVPWQDYVLVDEVVLIQRDTQVTAIDLTASTPIQVARGSPVTDQDGTRQATLLIPQGIQAAKMLPDGRTQPLTTLSLRLTEYTVGDPGPQAMPARLPPASAYTYAVELSADEASTKVNGQDVVFNQPVPFYVENFLNFPVGGEVPVGYYDNDRGVWVPQDNGRIIKILSVTGGRADLDVNGSGTPADPATLAALGISDAERERLAGLYSPGQSLWRVLLTHLSTWDCNWPFGPPPGATPPPADGPGGGDGGGGPGSGGGSGGGDGGGGDGGGGPGGGPPTPDPKPDDPCETAGSILECESQVLGERIALVGTALTLNYRSDRVAGRLASRTVSIRLSGEDVPATLKRIDLEIAVAGQHVTRTFPAQAQQTTTFTWEGKDRYGRAVPGTQTATIKIGYVYDGVYQAPAAGRGFGAPSGVAITGSRTRQEITLSRDSHASVSVPNTAADVGGWTLEGHHVYDPMGKTLYLGTGARRSVQHTLNSVITTVAGTGVQGFSGDGGPAVQAELGSPHDVAVAAEGSLYLVDWFNHRIRRVGPDGIITTVAGNGVAGYSGDGGPAVQAALHHPDGLALAPDGSLYIADTGNHRIRRVGPDGRITTVAGGGNRWLNEGEPAVEAELYYPGDVALAPEGSLYIADYGHHRVRRVGPDGRITTVAGTGAFSAEPLGEGGPAVQASLTYPHRLALGPEGSVYVTDGIEAAGAARLSRIGPDGRLTVLARQGTSYAPDLGDGGPAELAHLPNPGGVAVGPDRGVYVTDDNERIRRIGPDGIITTVAGGADYGAALGDGGPATQARLNISAQPGLAFDPDGSLYLADMFHRRVRRVAPTLPGLSVGEMLIASEEGRQGYLFDATGRHLRTRDTLTGATLYRFGYGPDGRLLTVTDAEGNVTTLERDARGNPVALVAPFGQRTSLTVDAQGYLATVTNPVGETFQMSYTAAGLLTRFTDPQGKASEMTYDGLGRLLTATNAAGGRQRLRRTALSEGGVGYRVSRLSALERLTTYAVQELATGERQRTVRRPDGTQTQMLIGTEGRVKTTNADGTVTDLLQGPDPRFGMQAPISQSLQITTAGLTSSLTREVTAALADQTDPLSLIQLTQTTLQNGRQSTRVYEAASRQSTVTSPAGRTGYTVLDAQGRVIETGVAGLEPVRYRYDSRGLLTDIRQGPGADERVTAFSYNTSGDLDTLTDPLGHATQLSYVRRQHKLTPWRQ